MSEWKTIDTAPKDGRVLLVCREMHSLDEAFVAQWSDYWREWWDIIRGRTFETWGADYLWIEVPEPRSPSLAGGE